MYEKQAQVNRDCTMDVMMEEAEKRVKEVRMSKPKQLLVVDD